jgi:phosphoribosylaminoimidazole-succinocarboxamide synthase
MPKSHGPESNTKQKGKDGVEMPAEVVEKTKARYTEVFERLTDNSLEDALKKLEK